MAKRKETLVKTILNIGLARNDGAPDNGVLHVVVKLNQFGFRLKAGEVHEVTHALGTERTLVVEVYPRDGIATRAAVYRLSLELAQDCIAVGFVQDGTVTSGELIGPKAADWGEFDPAYFVNLSA